MTRLGNVFESLESDRPRGPDLRVTVEVPREALGGSLRARVPLRLAAEGDLIERAAEPGDPEHLMLHLPATLPTGALLRLRGQGGVREGEQPGDLFVAIELVERPMSAEERVAGALAPSFDPTRGSTTLTWLLLLGFALLAAGTLALFFA